MRRFLGILALTLPLLFATALAPTQTVRADDWPTVLSLPDGWLPEGIVVGDGNILYSGSRRNGAIYAFDLATGAGRVLYEGRTGSLATGLEFDTRTGYIFAAGASSGELNVIDSTTGTRVMTYKLAQTAGPTFINDVAVTARAAYATDSNRPVIYRIPLGADGELSTQDDVQIIPLSGAYQHGTGTNLNGIEATPNGDRLIAAQSNAQKLLLIEPSTGKTTEIEVNGGPINGDGLLLLDRTLYSMRNTAGNGAAVKIDMAPNYLSGNVAAEIKHPAFDSPTTITLAGGRLYMVNARFSAGNAPTLSYTIVTADHIPSPGY